MAALYSLPIVILTLYSASHVLFYDIGIPLYVSFHRGNCVVLIAEVPRQFTRLPNLHENSHALPYTKADNTQMIPQAAANSFSIRGNTHTTARLNDKKISDAATKKTQNRRPHHHRSGTHEMT